MTSQFPLFHVLKHLFLQNNGFFFRRMTSLSSSSASRLVHISSAHRTMILTLMMSDAASLLVQHTSRLKRHIEKDFVIFLLFFRFSPLTNMLEHLKDLMYSL